MTDRVVRAHAGGVRVGLALVVAAGMAQACAFPIFHTDSTVDSRPARPVRQRTLHEAAAAPPGVAGAAVLAGPEDCDAALARAGVSFERVDETQARGVEQPIRLTGPVSGVTFDAADADARHAILDCRLGLALVRWASELRRAGVRRVEHYSIYRPGARVAGERRVSGHAHGMAIDAGRFTLDDGTVLDVLSDWEGRERGQAPCPRRDDEAFGSRVLRGLFCDAVERQLFQVALSPHHDRAHANHLHLERKPEVDWTYVR